MDRSGLPWVMEPPALRGSLNSFGVADLVESTIRQESFMHALVKFGLVAPMFFLAASSFAQQPGTSKSDKAGENTRKEAVGKKRADCRQAGRAKGLSGPDLVDHVSICVQEARLACLKQAIEQKIRGRERVSFISNCLEKREGTGSR
jgi:hypothetical protein